MKIAYQNQKLLDFFTDQTYETYAKINNNELLYTVYIELLIMIRPIRGYIFRNCLQKNVDSISNNNLVYIIIFLVVNFLFEIVFFIVIKFSIIDKKETLSFINRAGISTLTELPSIALAGAT